MPPGMIGKTIGVLLAPWAYAAGRALGRPQLCSKAVQLDGEFFRGYAEQLRGMGRSAEIMAEFTNAAKLCALVSPGGDQVVKELFSNSHAQLLQDVVCLLAHNRKRNGYFVEIGVGNGIDLSNTLMLERDFNWAGILAEPNRSFHEKILHARTAILDSRAVYESTGAILDLEEVANLGELSGLSLHRTARGRQEISVYTVETITLDDLLEENQAPSEIDYVSIDTEGSEVQILKSLSLKKRHVGFFTIEHNYDARRLEALRAILLPAGYREVLKEISMFDAWFMHRDLASDYLP